MITSRVTAAKYMLTQVLLEAGRAQRRDTVRRYAPDEADAERRVRESVDRAVDDLMRDLGLARP